ncbi:Dexamethasone-induced Ras-related protein 1 [Lamellibrachia satsuma]|nr:Dexamethasone-induced Ras-related protein 1 [Lamellibrachia satsuma]
MQHHVGSMAMLLEAERAPPDKCFRLVVLGSCRVGKTSIVKRFLGRASGDNLKVGSDDRYMPTIDDYHSKVYLIDGFVYRLDIVDTSGLCPFPAMRRVSLLIGVNICSCVRVPVIYVNICSCILVPVICVNICS